MTKSPKIPTLSLATDAVEYLMARIRVVKDLKDRHYHWPEGWDHIRVQSTTTGGEIIVTRWDWEHL